MTKMKFWIYLTTSLAFISAVLILASQAFVVLWVVFMMAMTILMLVDDVDD